MATIGINLIKTLEYTGRNQRIWDDKLKGFGISIQKESKSFIIQYRNQYGQQRYFTIGRVGVLAPDEARKQAKEALADVTKKQDPAALRQEDKNTMTVSELCNWYTRDGAHNKKPHTLVCDKGAIDNHIKPLIGNLPIKTINRGIMESFLQDVKIGDKTRRKVKSDNLRGVIKVRGGVFAASKALDLLGSMFEFAIRHDKLAINPAHGIKRPSNNIREVFLTIDEIRAMGQLFANPKVYATHKIAVDALKLILLTGCRKNEILTLKWEYIDFAEQCFRFPDTKTGAQIRPFGLGALHLLQSLEHDQISPFVFTATKKSADGHLVGLYKMFKTILGTRNDNGDLVFIKDGLDIHSLRHTFASMGEHLKHSPLVIGGLLGHKSKSIGITGRYIHVVDNDSLKAADNISLTIEQALNPEISNVDPETKTNTSAS